MYTSCLAAIAKVSAQQKLYIQLITISKLLEKISANCIKMPVYIWLFFFFLSMARTIQSNMKLAYCHISYIYEQNILLCILLFAMDILLLHKKLLQLKRKENGKVTDWKQKEPFYNCVFFNPAPYFMFCLMYWVKSRGVQYVIHQSFLHY